MAEWIIDQFPQHDCYVEPFGGAMSVMLTKPPSRLEVYNDQDDEVVNFFKVLRDDYTNLVRVIELTPFSRYEYIRAHQPCKNALERARRLYVRCWQGIGGTRADDHTGWRLERDGKRGNSNLREWNQTNHLSVIAKRLRMIQIESGNAIRVIERYDAPTTLFYCDPPYPHETRAKDRRKGYRHEMSAADHRKLAQVLHRISGMAIISSYMSDLYKELYAGWTLMTKLSRVNTMHVGAQLKTECLFISPRAAKQIKQIRFYFAIDDAMAKGM